jgi:hypothetical protein
VDQPLNDINTRMTENGGFGAGTKSVGGGRRFPTPRFFFGKAGIGRSGDSDMVRHVSETSFSLTNLLD